MKLQPVTMQMVAGWVKRWVDSFYLRRKGTQTLDGSLTVTGNVTAVGIIDGDSYVSSNLGGFYASGLPSFNTGQTLTITITDTGSANYQHITHVRVVLGNSTSDLVRGLYDVIVAWSRAAVGATATVRATNVLMNNTQNITVTAATATTDGFTLQFLAGANMTSSRNRLYVEDSRIDLITISTAVA